MWGGGAVRKDGTYGVTTSEEVMEDDNDEAGEVVSGATSSGAIYSRRMIVTDIPARDFTGSVPAGIASSGPSTRRSLICVPSPSVIRLTRPRLGSGRLPCT